MRSIRDYLIRTFLLYSFSIALLPFTRISATIIKVPQDEPTIQGGINAATTGDTVLVAPGRYLENINFNGKNLVLGSRFLVTGDTSYITLTVIDGNQSGSVVTFENGENSSAVLTGFTITNGAASRGGGILCLYNSSPSLANLTISDNSTGHYGGGIYCWSNSWSNSSPILSNVTISGNTSNSSGGGIYLKYSNPSLSNVTISGNTSNNSGGGIYILNSSPSFDTENRCNIYLNSALSFGNDLYAVSSPIIPVVVDTFTVMTPTNYHAFPVDDFTFDILNSKVEQVNADLYVSPEGDDANSGLAPSEPLQTIFFALTKILADSLNPHTIYLAQGVYSDSTSGENFPLNMLSYVSLSGESEEGVILDAEGQSNLLSFDQAQGITVENLTITGGGTAQYGGGGGIYCHNYSSPILSNVTISGNTSNYSGGGIFCSSSSPSLSNVTITGNDAYDSGGGMFFYNSNPRLVNVTISGNTANSSGGGMYFYNSSPSLSNVTISRNSATGTGFNRGGGMYFYNSSPSFDTENRCNIYFNSASSLGNDLYSVNSTMAVVVDTFTVMNPTNYHAFPVDDFTFDILNSKVEQVNADLYVSPEGDDANSGLAPSEPLQTIFFALTKILADSLNPHTIYLAQGVYSDSTSGENFPVNMLSYVSLSGESEEGVILDAEGQSRVLSFDQAQGITVENLTITGGSGDHGGGGIYLSNSNPNLVNVTINGNSAYGVFSSGYGGGIYCDNSSPILSNVTISGNTANSIGGGIYLSNSSPSLTNVNINGNMANYSSGGIYLYSSSPSLSNVTISGNTAEVGGGIYCYSSSPSLENVTISGNSATGTGFYSGGGGIYCRNNSSPSLANVTVSANTATYGGGIYCSDNSSPNLVNTILWNDSPQEIYFYDGGDPDSITIAYSDVQGGEAGIITNDNGTVNWLEGNIDADPILVDAANGDFNLQEGSPCVDAGTAFFVWDGDTLANVSDTAYHGIAPDMGAFESPYSVGVFAEHAIPTDFALDQNYPNPFNPTTTIEFSIPQSGFVTLTLFDLLGREVETILRERLDAGDHSVQWNASNVPSGIYFIRMESGNFSQVRKVTALK